MTISSRRVVQLLVLSPLVLGALWLAAIMVWALSTYSWGEMDWDGNGRTTVTEVLASSDIGRRASADGQCTEYFSLKDGLPLRVRCPAS